MVLLNASSLLRLCLLWSRNRPGDAGCLERLKAARRPVQLLLRLSVRRLRLQHRPEVRLRPWKVAQVPPQPPPVRARMCHSSHICSFGASQAWPAMLHKSGSPVRSRRCCPLHTNACDITLRRFPALRSKGSSTGSSESNIQRENEQELASPGAAPQSQRPAQGQLQGPAAPPCDHPARCALWHACGTPAPRPHPPRWPPSSAAPPLSTRLATPLHRQLSGTPQRPARRGRLRHRQQG